MKFLRVTTFTVILSRVSPFERFRRDYIRLLKQLGECLAIQSSDELRMQVRPLGLFYGLQRVAL